MPFPIPTRTIARASRLADQIRGRAATGRASDGRAVVRAGRPSPIERARAGS